MKGPFLIYKLCKDYIGETSATMCYENQINYFQLIKSDDEIHLLNEYLISASISFLFFLLFLAADKVLSLLQDGNRILKNFQ